MQRKPYQVKTFTAPLFLLLCVISSTTSRFYRTLPIAISSSRFASITPNSCSFARENWPSIPRRITHQVTAFRPRDVNRIVVESLVPASRSIACLPYVWSGQNIIICFTSCFLHPHGQPAVTIPGTLRVQRKSARPIFPVRNQVATELAAFASPLWRPRLPSSPCCAGDLIVSGILSQYFSHRSFHLFSLHLSIQAPVIAFAALAQAGVRIGGRGGVRESISLYPRAWRDHAFFSSAGVFRNAGFLPLFGLSLRRILALPSITAECVPLIA